MQKNKTKTKHVLTQLSLPVKVVSPSASHNQEAQGSICCSFEHPYPQISYSEVMLS